MEYVTQLDHSKFIPDRFNQLWLRNRDNGSNHVRFMVARVPSGASGPPLHIHKFDQIYYVYQGTMELEIGLQRYTAGPHTLVILPAGVPHRNWNDGSEVEMHVNLQVPEGDSATGNDIFVRLEAHQPRQA